MSLSDLDPRAQWKWKLPPVTLVKNQALYCDLVSGKSVLHIGCTDHKELIDLKMKDHTYLHVKLMQNAKVVHGVDINKEAIQYLQTKYGISNIYYYNIASPPPYGFALLI